METYETNHKSRNLQELLDELMVRCEDGETFGTSIKDEHGREFVIIPVSKIFAYEEFVDGTKIVIPCKVKINDIK